MYASQSSTKQRNGVLSRLDHLSERDFVDNGVPPKNELHHSGLVRTWRRIYDAKIGTYKPV